ncbi:MAG: ROK family protein [Candidatus Saccharimonadales bacterium]
MYLGVDIGGTKTLVAVLSDDGIICEQQKFATPKTYTEFINELGKVIQTFEAKDFRAAGVAIPGRVDRVHGIGRRFGNLSWKDVPIQHDVERVAHCPVIIENDANLAGLSEAMLLKRSHQKVLYITVSTGIGTGFIVNQKIDPSLADSEGGNLMLQRGDKLVKWESFASGKAIAARYGKQASEISDQKTWQAIARDLAIGIIDLLAITQPDVVVIGGGVGHYLDRFDKYLVEELQNLTNPMLPIPPVQEAQRPDEAVIYGCYDVVKATYGRHTH